MSTAKSRKYLINELRKKRRIQEVIKTEQLSQLCQGVPYGLFLDGWV